MGLYRALTLMVVLLSQGESVYTASSIFLKEENLSTRAKPCFIYSSISLVNKLNELQRYMELIKKLQSFKATQSKTRQKYLSSILVNIKASVDNINRFHETVKNKARNLEVPSRDKLQRWSTIANWKSHQYMKQNLNYIRKRSILKNIMHTGIKLITDNLNGFIPLNNLIKLGRELFIKGKPENAKINTKIFQEIQRVNNHYNELNKKLNQTNTKIFNNQLNSDIIMLAEKIIKVCSKMDHTIELLFNTIFSGKLTYGIFDAQDMNAAVRRANTDLKKDGRLMTEFNPYKMESAMGLEMEKGIIHLILKAPTKRVANYKVVQLLTKRLIVNTQKGLKIIKIVSNKAYVKKDNTENEEYSIIDKYDVNRLTNSMFQEDSIKLWTNKKPDCLEVIEKQSLNNILDKCNYIIEQENTVTEIVTDNKICIHTTKRIYARKTCQSNTELMVMNPGSNLIKMEIGCIFQIKNKTIRINADFMQKLQSSTKRYYHQINLPININKTSLIHKESNSEIDVTAIINLFMTVVNLVAISVLYMRIIWLKYNQMRNRLEGN